MVTVEPGLIVHLPDEAATHAFAQDLAAILRTGDVVAMTGDLGAGKTTLARALIRQLAGEPELDVPSPTYTLTQTYETAPKVTHFDLYRLADDSELDELGFEEAAETGIVLVEWPERARQVLEEANLTIALRIAPDGGRDATLSPTPELALRLARSLAIRQFLVDAGFDGAHRMPFPADASMRRYERATHDGRSMVLMDAPAQPPGPAIRDGRAYTEIAHIARDVRPFVAIAEELAARGFTAPRILAADIPAGLVLLSDLGVEGIVTPDGSPIPARYEASARALARLHAEDFTGPIETRHGFAWTIPPFDRPALSIEVELLADWYWPRQHGEPIPDTKREAFRAAWSATFDALEGARRGLVMRDFHSPNILWQAAEDGPKRIGLLDFQDAMIGPVAYDLASLAQDARVNMPLELEEAVSAAYLEEALAIDPAFDAEMHAAQYAIMAAQRATKLLGLFVRLHERDGKPQYLRHIPRIQTYLNRSLMHPANARLKAIYDDWGVTGA